MPFGLFNSNYLLLVLIPTLVLSAVAQLFVRNAYSKWSNTRNSRGLTGPQVAEAIIAATDELRPVRLEGTQGQLTDHFDPAENIVRMSEGVATLPSVASMAIVAHELGHAQQYAEKSLLITARSFLVPAVRISPTVSYFLIMIGLFTSASGLLELGILFFGITVVFMLLTLPVEIDASMRGLRLLRTSGVMTNEEDMSGARQMLTAAAMTYIAAAVTAVLQLLYYLSLAQRRN